MYQEYYSSYIADVFNTKTRTNEAKGLFAIKDITKLQFRGYVCSSRKRIQNKQHKHKPTNRGKQLRTIKRLIMLQNILELLKFAKGETENIRIAQGKYELPSGLMSTGKKIKREAGWKK